MFISLKSSKIKKEYYTLDDKMVIKIMKRNYFYIVQSIFHDRRERKRGLPIDDTLPKANQKEVRVNVSGKRPLLKLLPAQHTQLQSPANIAVSEIRIFKKSKNGPA